MSLTQDEMGRLDECFEHLSRVVGVGVSLNALRNKPPEEGPVGALVEACSVYGACKVLRTDPCFVMAIMAAVAGAMMEHSTDQVSIALTAPVDRFVAATGAICQPAALRDFAMLEHLMVREVSGKGGYDA